MKRKFFSYGLTVEKRDEFEARHWYFPVFTHDNS